MVDLKVDGGWSGTCNGVGVWAVRSVATIRDRAITGMRLAVESLTLAPLVVL